MNLGNWKAQYAQLPAPLRKIVDLRLVGVLLGLVLTFLTSLLSEDYRLFLPTLGLLILSIADGCLLFRRLTAGDYLVLSGPCTAVEQSFLRRRTRAVFAKLENVTVKIKLNRYYPNSLPGEIVTVYLSPQSPIYEDGNIQVLYRYYAILFAPVSS